MEEYTLIGLDGNSFGIIAYVRRAMRNCGMCKEDIEAYVADAESGNYAHLIDVSMAMCEQLNERNDL